jgi:heme A synthase
MNTYYKILWIFLWTTIPISLILLIASNITMISIFNKLFGMYIVETNENTIPLSDHYRNDFNRYKLMSIILFFILLFLFCILLNNRLPTNDYGNVLNILFIFLLVSIGIAILGIPCYMLYMCNDFIKLRNRKRLFNN